MLEFIIKKFTKTPMLLYKYRHIKNLMMYLIVHLLIILTVVLLWNMFYTYDNQIDTTNKFSLLFSSFTALSIILVYYQSRKNMDWNKRQLTALELVKYVDSNKMAREEINKYYNYSSRFGTGKPFDEDELHKMFCEYTTDGKGNIIYTRQNPNKTQPYKLKELHIKQSDNSEQILQVGAIIRGGIIKILNNYELIAANVLNGAFDEQMTKDIFENGFIQHYHMYKDYIKHLQSPQHYDDDGAYTNLIWLAKKWTDESSKTIRDT